ncbi:hypothetical protein C2S51_026085 [Perilla frutescens var. frutescens]|nr:hypothetical protein C2S51_026085 [Perilla frutescens var. frutescens]
MADSTIYIFRNRNRNRDADADAVGASSSMLVYSYKLLPETSSDVTLDADSSLYAGTMRPKVHPLAVRHGLKILVFSTKIYVAKYEGDTYGDNRTDFEIYDTKNNTVEELPKLSLRKVDSVLQFFDIETKTWKPIYGLSVKGGYRGQLEIYGFSVIDDRTFVVLTNFNRMFCLDLVCLFKNGWQLYEGVTILGLHQTFVTKSGFNVDAYGVYHTTQAANKDLTDLIYMEGMGCSEARVCFPLSSFGKIRYGSCSCMGTFVEGDPQHRSGTVFAAQTMFDDDDRAYPYWIVDKLALDFEKLPARDLVEEADDEWAKCVASHKSVGEEKCWSFLCLGLFPF